MLIIHLACVTSSGVALDASVTPLVEMLVDTWMLGRWWEGNLVGCGMANYGGERSESDANLVAVI